MDFEDKEAVLADEQGVVTGTNEDGTNLSTGKQEKETSVEATAEKKQEEQTPPPAEDKKQDEENVPFHKHPAWQRREDEWNKKLDETRFEYEKRMQELESRLPKQEQVITTSPFLKKLVGEDPELAKDWEAEKESIRKATIEAYEAQQQEQVKARQVEEQRWLNWVDTSIKSLKDSGKEFDDNELKAIAIKYKPTDEMGNIDFNLAYELLAEKKAKELQKEEDKSTARKKLASDTNSTNKGETTKRAYLTHDDIQRGAANL